MTVLNINTLSLVAEIGSSFGMLLLTSGALIYTMKSKTRVQSWTNVTIFVCLIIAFAFQSTLSIYDLRTTGDKADVANLLLSNALYAV